MLQIAKILGIGTIMISSSDEKLMRLKAMGADVLINYRSNPDWAMTVRDRTGGRGVDLALDIGGQSTFAPAAWAAS